MSSDTAIDRIAAKIRDLNSRQLKVVDSLLDELLEINIENQSWYQ